MEVYLFGSSGFYCNLDLVIVMCYLARHKLKMLLGPFCFGVGGYDVVANNLGQHALFCTIALANQDILCFVQLQRSTTCF